MAFSGALGLLLLFLACALPVFEQLVTKSEVLLY